MLERATACLKARARDSLKCAQHAKAQAPRSASRRRLHSTFWTHGAGDIDFDISLLGIGAGAGAGAGTGEWTGLGAHLPTDLAWRHDDIRSNGPARRPHRKDALNVNVGTSIPSTNSPEVPYLDFLYPPHALALLQRSNGQPWERWEKRNVRRLPEGFVQASRGYASRSHVRKAEAKEQVDGPPPAASDAEPDDHARAGEDDIEHHILAEEEDEHLQAFTHIEGTDSSEQGEPPTPNSDVLNAVHMIRELADKSEGEDNTEHAAEDEYREASDESSAISPGELSEEQARDFDTVTNPFEALRAMISARRKLRTVEDISRAWSLYSSLSDTAKIDARLMHELLLWFSKFDIETAQAHSISLFWAIPLQEKTLSDYEAVLRAFLSRGAYAAVTGVHREALQNIPNGHQITKQLFEHAVTHGKWRAALAVKEDHDNAFAGDGSAEARQKALFWINVAEIPDLIEKAHALMRFCRRLYFRKHKDAAKFTAFSVAVSEEAFRKTLASPSDWKPHWKSSVLPQVKKTRRMLIKLVDSICMWSPNASRLCEDFLVKLLNLNQTEEQYRQVHNIVSYIYGQYREMRDIHPSVTLYETLLARLCQHALELRTLSFSEESVSIEVIVEDWQKHHTVLNCWAVEKLMSHYARLGMLEPLNAYYDYLKRHYPAYEDQEKALSSLIYVHARRAELEKAQEAFDHVESIARLNGTAASVKHWSILVHAQARVDDLAGGLDTLRRIVSEAKLVPDHRTIHPLLEMLARRGDSDGIADLLKQYDTLTGELHTTSFVGSQMRALINSQNVPEAETLLKKAMEQVRKHEIQGSLTGCFNILISAYARRRDIDATMRTYRWMKAERVWVDRYTYNGLMLVLIHFRQTPAAYTIMSKVMQRDGFTPTAVHYAIIMTGLVQQRLYDRAIWLHEKMWKRNIRPSLATRRVYLQAVAMKERAENKARDTEGEPAPLKEVVNELRNALVESDGFEIASKDPVLGLDRTSGRQDIREHFASLLFIHGKQRCFEAVHEMFKMYQDEASRIGKANAIVPMQVLTAMMHAHFRSGDYDRVEAYWQIAKDNADRIAPAVAVPDYERLKVPDVQSSVVGSSDAGSKSLVNANKHELDRAEIGFESNHAVSNTNTQALLPASPQTLGPRPSPGFTYILTRPLRYYLRALAVQNRIADVLTTFTALVRQGYTFDIITWNRLIEYLCSASPPLALLAFTLTERYLMPNFPGWIHQPKTRRLPRRAAVEQGLQFIRGRYLSYDALAPQYRTMVFLTSALLKLRRMEAMGSLRPKEEIGRFVGTIRQIESVAPRTLDAVNSMPQVAHDRLQHRLLRSGKANQL